MLELAADRFVDSHVLRVNVPSLEGGVLRVTPLDVNFITAGDAEQRPSGRTGNYTETVTIGERGIEERGTPLAL